MSVQEGVRTSRCQEKQVSGKQGQISRCQEQAGVGQEVSGQSRCQSKQVSGQAGVR